MQQNACLTLVLENYNYLKVAMGDKPAVSYEKPPNLKQSLSNNRLYNSHSHQGTRTCSSPRCQLCPLMNTAHKITI